jgi:hypothetical protein
MCTADTDGFGSRVHFHTSLSDQFLHSSEVGPTGGARSQIAGQFRRRKRVFMDGAPKPLDIGLIWTTTHRTPPGTEELLRVRVSRVDHRGLRRPGTQWFEGVVESDPRPRG